jgi:hypothetical protein
MSVLYKFSESLTGQDKSGPPYKISAGKLDQNFQACSPIPQDGDSDIIVTQTKDGWKLELKQDLLDQGSGLPAGVVFKQFDVCENGQPVQYWMATRDEDPS